MNWRSIRVVYFKELRDLLRDRRTIISMIVVPVLVIPVLMMGIGGFAVRMVKKAAEEAPSVMILGETNSPAVAAQLRDLPKLKIVPADPDYTNLISNKKVRAAVEIPILRKDFIVERYQILEAVAAGADAVLVIVGAVEPWALKRLLADAASVGVAALVEVHGAVELRIAADSGATLIGVNSRNLRTLGVEPDVHDQLAPLMPKGVVTVAESGLRELGDLQRLERAGYDAFLVGERLIAQPDPGAALRTLRGVDA